MESILWWLVPTVVLAVIFYVIWRFTQRNHLRDINDEYSEEIQKDEAALK